MILVGITLRLRTAFRTALILGIAAPAVGCLGGQLVEETPRQITLEGRLESGRIGEWDCVWLVDATGRKFDVIYPSGWHVESNPVRLLDPSGAVVAAQGRAVVVSGPEGIGESVCGPNVFAADTVRGIGPRSYPIPLTEWASRAALSAVSPYQPFVSPCCRTQSTLRPAACVGKSWSETPGPGQGARAAAVPFGLVKSSQNL